MPTIGSSAIFAVSAAASGLSLISAGTDPDHGISFMLHQNILEQSA